MAVSVQKRGWFNGGLHARRNPYVLMLFLAMGSSTILFLFLVLMLVVRKLTVSMPGLAIPHAFWFSTLVLILSSVTLRRARQFFLAERYKEHLQWSSLTLWLGVLFLLTQILGWWQLYQSGFTLQDSMGAAFLYLLSGLHFAHMGGALILLAWAVIDSRTNRTYVDGYLQSIDPAKRTRLQLAYWFWQFADGLWVLLFAVFYFLLRG